MVVPAALASPATFQSTPPVKAATAVDRVTLDTTPFQSTPPVKAATKTSDIRIGICPFQSTPPVKAATLNGRMSRECRYFNPRRP